MKNFRRILILILGLVGLLLSAYLFKVHGSMETGVCNISSVFSCNSVDQSAYSEIFGIPVSLLGMLFYVAVIGGLLKRTYLKKLVTKFISLKNFDYVYLSMLIFGVIFGIYLTIIEAFVIEAYCIYCLTSFAITILLAILFYYEMKATNYSKLKKKTKKKVKRKN